MSLLSAEELGAIQSLAQSGMSGTATILVRAIVETEDGQESVWATNGEDVACWVYENTSAGATLGAISGAVGISEQFSIRLPVGSDAHTGDELAVGSTIYSIQHTNSDDSYPAWLNCACRTIE